MKKNIHERIDNILQQDHKDILTLTQKVADELADCRLTVCTTNGDERSVLDPLLKKQSE